MRWNSLERLAFGILSVSYAAIPPARARGNSSFGLAVSVGIGKPRRGMGYRQPDADRGALAFLTLDQQLAAMAVDDVLDDRQPQSGAADCAGASLVGAVEPFGQPRQMLAAGCRCPDRRPRSRFRAGWASGSRLRQATSRLRPRRRGHISGRCPAGSAAPAPSGRHRR